MHTLQNRRFPQLMHIYNYTRYTVLNVILQVQLILHVLLKYLLLVLCQSCKYYMVSIDEYHSTRIVKLYIMSFIIPYCFEIKQRLISEHNVKPYSSEIKHVA